MMISTVSLFVLSLSGSFSLLPINLEVYWTLFAEDSVYLKNWSIFSNYSFSGYSQRLIPFELKMFSRYIQDCCRVKRSLVTVFTVIRAFLRFSASFSTTALSACRESYWCWQDSRQVKYTIRRHHKEQRLRRALCKQWWSAWAHSILLRVFWGRLWAWPH